MVLDHLRIVNFAFADVIRLLRRGQVPARVARTADVKPDPRADVAVLETFEQSCDAFTQSAGGAGSLRTAARYAHPWFGSLDAAGWHTLGGFHMLLHRHQMEKILHGLAPTATNRPG